MLEARRQQIAAGLANAQKIERELAAIAASRQEILAKADGEARHLIEEARVGAAHVHADLTRKAKKAAEDLLERARQEAMHDRARLYAEFRSEAGRLVAQTTAAVTGKILTPDDHRRIAEDAARQLHS
jgi:F-type H+-transporting ATPase subunit b